MTTGRDPVRTAAFAVLIGSAVVLSYATLRQVALAAGFTVWSSWLFPPAVDATIVVASRCCRDTMLARRTRRLAVVVVVASIAAGVAAFVVHHLAHGLVGVGFAVVVPLALAAALVLTSWSATDRRLALAEAERRAQRQAERREVKHTAPGVTPASTPAAAGGGLVDRARPLVADGAGRARLARQLGVSTHQARQVLDTIRAERASLAVAS